MNQVITAVGLLACLCGFGLMIRFGFRFRTRLKFGGALPATEMASPEEIRQHNQDVKGRLGFCLVVAGVLMQAGGAYCVWWPLGS